VADVSELNRDAWDAQVAKKNRWTIPVSPQEIEAARRGEWEILLTPMCPVPRSWFPELEGTRVLCLASGGGQQGPILAATGARVTVFDNSPRQLAQDRLVAERDGLELKTIEGDMADLGVFRDGVFDLIVHPVANCFVPDLQPVWSECSRVLRVGGERFVRSFRGADDSILRSRVTDRGAKGEVRREGRTLRVRPHSVRPDRGPATRGLRSNRFLRGRLSAR